MIRVESPDLDDRLAWMIDEIEHGKRDPRVRKIAGDILTRKTIAGDWEVPERDWDAEVDAVYRYVREKVRFTRDIHEVELFQKPKRTLEHAIGDCDDIAILIGSICQAVGYPVILRVIGLRGGPFQHVYAMAGIPPHSPTKYKPLDASRAEGAGWEQTDGVTSRRDYAVETSEE